MNWSKGIRRNTVHPFACINVDMRSRIGVGKRPQRFRHATTSCSREPERKLCNSIKRWIECDKMSSFNRTRTSVQDLFISHQSLLYNLVNYLSFVLFCGLICKILISMRGSLTSYKYRSCLLLYFYPIFCPSLLLQIQIKYKWNVYKYIYINQSRQTD